MPPIPPAVVEFAEQNGYKDISLNKFWQANTPYNTFKGCKVYDVNDKDVYFRFILVNDKDIRMATDEEIKDITDIFL